MGQSRQVRQMELGCICKDPKEGKQDHNNRNYQITKRITAGESLPDAGWMLKQVKGAVTLTLLSF